MKIYMQFGRLYCYGRADSVSKLGFLNSYRRFKDQDIQNYNLARCFVWVWNLVADIAGGKEAEGVREQGVEENIWT